MAVARGEVARDSVGAFSDRPAKLRMSYIYKTTQAQGHQLVNEKWGKVHSHRSVSNCHYLSM